MLKMKLTRFYCGALLVSALGLASFPAAVGEPFTRLAPLARSAEAAHADPTLPAIPPELAAVLASSHGIRLQATPTKTPAQAAPAKPAGQPGEPATSRQAEQQRAAIYQDLNQYVLSVIKSYQGQEYPYLLNSDYAHYNGVTSDLYFQDQLLLRAHPSGNRASHCVGITFEVFFKAVQQRNQAIGSARESLNGMSFSDLQDFVLTWYAAAGPKVTSNPASALVKYGLGKEITSFEQARAGDFIDFSRSNGTGHSVILQSFLSEDGAIVGLRYWSSQESTAGIGYKTEYFSPKGGILRSDFYIGRAGPVSSWKQR